MRARSIPFCMFLALVTAVAACDDDDDDQEPIFPADAT
jgi:hypothetical protein